MIAIYSEAVEALKRGDAFYAGKKFKEAESLLPQSNWAAKASLMHGYSHYSRNAYSDSVFSLERHIQELSRRQKYTLCTLPNCNMLF